MTAQETDEERKKREEEERGRRGNQNSNPGPGIVATFDYDNLGTGLSRMWGMSNSGTEHARETSGYLVLVNGQVRLIVFDSSTNTPTISLFRFPGKEWIIISNSLKPITGNT